jgi:putative tryptophan/tyrosine transport system substrate-binding protein
MVGRRGFLLTSLAGALGAPLGVQAQQAARTPMIGYLTPFALSGPVSEAFQQGLRDYGYVEGENVRIESRTTGGENQKYAALASELVSLRPNVLVAQGGLATLALKPLTSSIPIVMAAAADAVAQGIVESLARPGGNITGLTMITPELIAKRFQILKEALPRTTRVATIGCGGVGYQLQLQEVTTTSRTLALQVEVIEPRA